MPETFRHCSGSSKVIWDGAVRACHWALVVLFCWLFLSGHFGWLPALHLWAGYLFLVVLLFRVEWGLWGSESARFTRMLRSLPQFGSAFTDLGQRHPGHWPGHNPVGAVSVFLMLFVLLALSLTGLFVESWGELRGPLSERVERRTAVWLSDLHGLLRWPALGLVVVHVGAALHHLLWKRENRIGAILLHGRLTLPADPSLRRAHPAAAMLALAAAAAAVALIVWLGPID